MIGVVGSSVLPTVKVLVADGLTIEYINRHCNYIIIIENGIYNIW